VEGQAAIAEQNAHADDDGVVDKHEQKQIDKAKKKALESRHRGWVPSNRCSRSIYGPALTKYSFRFAAKCSSELSELRSG
jgi:hypothetical protein